MIPISNELRAAMKKAAEDVGNPYQLSLKAGVSNATVLKWLDGKTSKIYEKTLDQLLPWLIVHMSAEEVENYHRIVEYSVAECKIDLARVDESCTNVDNLRERLEVSEHLLEQLNYVMNQKTNAAVNTQKSEKLPNEAVSISDAGVTPKAVPVLSFAQAAGYEPALEPMCDYLRETSDRNAVFYDVPENCFALEVSGDSMAPDYPNGSIALVAAGEFPQRGDIVAAKLHTGQVVIKKYHRCNNVITLQSINPEGKNFEWHCKEQPGFVMWMWPVIEITLKPRDQRWARIVTHKN